MRGQKSTNRKSYKRYYETKNATKKLTMCAKKYNKNKKLKRFSGEKIQQKGKKLQLFENAIWQKKCNRMKK